MAEQHRGSWVLEAFRKLGVDTKRLACELPRELEQIADYPDTVTPDEVSLVLNTCAEQTGNTHFGLHLVEIIPASDLGVFAYLLFNAPTIGEFLTLAARYYPIFYRGAVLELRKQRKLSRFVYRRADIPRVSQRHDVEWTLGFFVHSIRSKLGTDWMPMRVTFQEPEPGDVMELTRFFGTNLVFDYPVNSFEIDASSLDAPLNESDPHLLKIMMQQADALLQTFAATESIESHVRLLIMKDIESGPPSAGLIARQMGMSLSTFKRRLAERKLTFRGLRDAVVGELAKQALVDTDLKISQVAMQLGYSEVSGFNHAFARLVGQSPREYRRHFRQA